MPIILMISMGRWFFMSRKKAMVALLSLAKGSIRLMTSLRLHWMAIAPQEKEIRLTNHLIGCRIVILQAEGETPSMNRLIEFRPEISNHDQITGETRSKTHLKECLQHRAQVGAQHAGRKTRSETQSRACPTRHPITATHLSIECAHWIVWPSACLVNLLRPLMMHLAKSRRIFLLGWSGQITTR